MIYVLDYHISAQLVTKKALFLPFGSKIDILSFFITPFLAGETNLLCFSVSTFAYFVGYCIVFLKTEDGYDT